MRLAERPNLFETNQRISRLNYLINIVEVVELKRPICPVLGVLGDAHNVNLKHLAVYKSIRIEQTLLGLADNIVEGKITEIADVSDNPGSKLVVDHPKDNAGVNSGL